MLGALGRNLPIKITSLVLATLLWAMVAGQREVIRTLRVALDLPALPDSLMYLQSPPASVQVTFRASGRKLFWLRLRPPLLRPGLSLQATDEPVVLRLREELLDLPRQFSGTVMDISPANLRVQIAAVGEKEVPVKVVVGKEPRHPYRLAEGSTPVATPSHVRARGPRERVDRMPWVRTEFLDLSDETESGVRAVSLEAPDSLLRFEPSTVQVRYEIEAWQPE
ncbi:MAG: YbbR-like domain-containing protein [Candidatus Krumholzibacteriia bacterium]|nr:YbbR-like domain-containing protein [bacterium]MCB9512715.1 YbbR-like domain-containing protein [Candidatus Latescibacterota bacterium]MCB9516799.1 YbbR-like domain-containing protein [Candidatus Latescibacterota bacterium]